MGRAPTAAAHSLLSAAIERNDAVTLTGVMVDDPTGPSYAASVLVRVEVADTHRIVLAGANGDDVGAVPADRGG